MTIKKKILKNTIYNILSNIVVRFLQAIQTIFIANLFGPTYYGIKSSIQLYYSYGNNAHLGTIDTFSKKRQLTELSNVKSRDNYTNLIFSIISVLSLILFILGIIIEIFLVNNPIYKWSILIVSLLIIVSFYNNIISIILQSKQNFRLLAKYNFIGAILSTIIIIFFSYFFGVIGFFLGSLVSGIIVIFLIYPKLDYKPKFIFKLREYWLFIKAGFNLFILKYSLIILSTVDNISIWLGYGVTELGLYSVGMFFSNLLNFLVSTLLTPIIPNIYQNVDNNSKIKTLILQPYKLVMQFSYFIIFIALFLLPIIVDIFFPKYSSGIKYMYILMLGYIFFPVLINDYYIAKNNELKLFLITAIFIVLEIITNLLIIYFKLAPIYIAYSICIAYFFFGFFVNLIGYKYILGSWGLSLKEIIDYIWPFFYALSCYGLLWILAHYWLFSIFSYYWVKIIQTVLFIILYCPILWKIEKEHKIVKLIWNGLKNKFKKGQVDNIDIQ